MITVGFREMSAKLGGIGSSSPCVPVRVTLSRSAPPSIKPIDCAPGKILRAGGCAGPVGTGSLQAAVVTARKRVERNQPCLDIRSLRRLGCELRQRDRHRAGPARRAAPLAIRVVRCALRREVVLRTPAHSGNGEHELVGGVMAELSDGTRRRIRTVKVEFPVLDTERLFTPPS